MAGKYAHIINSLPKYTGLEPDYQTKINAVKSAMLTEDPNNRFAWAVAEKYTEIRLEKEIHEDLLSEVNLRLAAIAQLLEECYENEGVTSLKLASGPTVRVQSEPHAVTVDREAVRLWAIKEGLEKDLQLPWMTLNKLTKEALLRGEEEPDGVVAHQKSKIVMVKG